MFTSRLYHSVQGVAVRNQSASVCCHYDQSDQTYHGGYRATDESHCDRPSEILSNNSFDSLAGVANHVSSWWA